MLGRTVLCGAEGTKTVVVAGTTVELLVISVQPKDTSKATLIAAVPTALIAERPYHSGSRCLPVVSRVAVAELPVTRRSRDMHAVDVPPASTRSVSGERGSRNS